MIDAMDRLKVPKCKAAQANKPVQFGQKTTPIHSQPTQQGDVFVKSAKPAEANSKASAPAQSKNPMGAALQNFVKQASKADNPLMNALKKLAPASPPAQLEASRKPAEIPAGASTQSPFLKAGEHTLASPEKAFATQPTSAQINTRNKVNLFAGAAVTSAGLGALTGMVMGPAAIAANPALLNKMIALLPTQLP
ncbi:hypothetical protein [Vampirovibrio sp.]|uniref:hypothetical protein n=1 Tax=Vampirovibrio sp. TaxID=2717857 RepID=UPI003593C3FA